MTSPPPSRARSSSRSRSGACFEEPGGFEEPEKLDPSGPDFSHDRDGPDEPQLNMAPGAAALAIFVVLRGLLPLLDTIVDVPRGLGAVLLLAAGASGAALMVAGAINIWRSWGM